MASVVRCSSRIRRAERSIAARSRDRLKPVAACIAASAVGPILSVTSSRAYLFRQRWRSGDCPDGERYADLGLWLHRLGTSCSISMIWDHPIVSLTQSAAKHTRQEGERSISSHPSMKVILPSVLHRSWPSCVPADQIADIPDATAAKFTHYGTRLRLRSELPTTPTA